MKRSTKKPTLYFIFSYDKLSKEIDLTISVNEKLEDIERFISYIDYIMAVSYTHLTLPTTERV